jgi:hypothetical protein
MAEGCSEAVKRQYAEGSAWFRGLARPLLLGCPRRYL